MRKLYDRGLIVVMLESDFRSAVKSLSQATLIANLAHIPEVEEDLPDIPGTLKLSLGTGSLCFSTVRES